MHRVILDIQGRDVVADPRAAEAQGCAAEESGDLVHHVREESGFRSRNWPAAVKGQHDGVCDI